MKIKLLVLLLLSSPAFAGAKLAWDANTETDIKGYKIYYGIASRQYVTTIDVGNVTTWTVPALAPKIQYFFAVTAYNTAGLESNFSGEVTYTPIAPPGNLRLAPTPPTASLDTGIRFGKYISPSDRRWNIEPTIIRIEGRTLALSGR